jgi:hypothetical protein
MSRSNPTLTNPAEHFFEWSGSKGLLQWWDKENQKNVQVKLPFEFLVLDELATITGYSKYLESGYWSNEVRNISKDELFVRTKKGPFEAGLYANLAQTRAKGGKYAQSIYLAHKIGDEWVIGNIKAHGSALSAWIEFSKSHATETGKITMTRGEKESAPTGEYYPPLFSWAKSSHEEDEVAKDLDRELQIYLNQYLATPKGETDLSPDDDLETIGKATPEQEADFEKLKAEKKAPHEDTVVTDIDDEPVNLDDIPF